jgi:hypothetical protein
LCLIFITIFYSLSKELTVHRRLNSRITVHRRLNSQTTIITNPQPNYNPSSNLPLLENKATTFPPVPLLTSAPTTGYRHTNARFGWLTRALTISPARHSRSDEDKMP